MSNQLLIDLFQAYYDARRYKRNTISALRFEIDLEHNLLELYQELKTGAYQISQSLAFVVFDPVQREIIASPFRDRVVHHLVFNYINPIFEKIFINDSYSCRRGKGVSYGIKRVTHFIRSSSYNYQKNSYILKLDIAGYFMSINQMKLYAKIEKYLLKNNSNYSFDLGLILGLLKKIIFHDYTKNCLIRGGTVNWQGLPPNKSLFFTPAGFGLPIGNLTSQLFSNIYLNNFDHFIKRNLKFKYYGRYVDDLVIVASSKEKLQIAVIGLKEYLATDLNLKLHPKKIYLQPCLKGVNFLGAVIKPRRIYVGRRTKNNFYQLVTKINAVLKNEVIDKQKLLKISAGINSYLGMLGQYKTYYLRQKILTKQLSPIFWDYFKLINNNDKYQKVILRRIHFSAKF